MNQGMVKFGTTLLAIISVALGSPALANETYYAPHGARGDFGDDLRCKPGYYVVGFEGGTGQIMDRIALRCARIKSDGTANASEIVTDSLGGGGGGAGFQELHGRRSRRARCCPAQPRSKAG